MAKVSVKSMSVEESTALVHLTKIGKALQEAKTFDDFRNVRTMAKMGFQALKSNRDTRAEDRNELADYVLRAEYAMGRILDEGGRKGDRATSKDTLFRGDIVSPREELPPTLSEIGVTKKQSSRWQSIASIPEERFEQVTQETKEAREELTQALLLKVAKKLKKEERRTRAATAGKAAPATTVGYSLRHGDLADEMDKLESASVDTVITDPPYPVEYLSLYEVLAEKAARVLRDGGLCVVMCGQSYLPEIYAMMLRHLTYHWTAAYLTPGGQSVQLFPRKVNTFWKPLLIYSKGKYDGKWFGDVAKSSVNDNDKEHHDWGQSVSGMLDVVSRFSEEGDLILDPFVGAGTTGVACLKLKRRFIGIDRDEERIAIARGRLASG